MAVQDAYEACLNFYGCSVVEVKNNTPIKIFQLLYQNGLVLDSIERDTRVQAVQEFSRRLKYGIYNSIFVPSNSNCEIR